VKNSKSPGKSRRSGFHPNVSLSRRMGILPMSGHGLEARVTLVAILFLICSTASAETGNIAGRVVDPGGYPIAGVNVMSVTHRYGAATDTEGRFNIPGLPPSSYSFVFSHLGYLTDTLEVVVSEAKTSTLLVVLKEDILELQGVELVIDRERIEDQATSGRMIVRRSEVSALPGGTEDPLRAMTLIPGVVARNPDDADWSVRGADMSEMRVLLDGISLPRPTHFGLLSRSLSIFNPLVTDRFELWKGGMPANYGRALGGLLQVESKDSDADELQGSVILTYLTGNLGWEVPIAESVHWVSGVRLNYDPGVYRFLEQTFRDRFVRPTIRDAQGSLRIDAGRDHRLRLTYLVSSDRLESSSSTGILDHRNQLLAGGLGWSWTPAAGWFSRMVVYGWETRESLLNVDLRSEENWNNRRVGIRADNTVLVSSGGRFVFGGVVETEEGDRRDPVAKAELSGTLRDVYGAGFAEAQVKWGQLHTAAGVRADGYGWQVLDGGAIQSHGYYLYRINPRVSLGYYLTPAVILKGSWGTFTQPVDTALYDATQWSAGIEVHRGSWSWEVTGYLHDREHDYEGIRRYANGIEVLARRREGAITGWMGGSFGVSEREAKDMLEPTLMDRRWTVLGALLWSVRYDWRLSSELFFGTGFPISPVDGRVYVYSNTAAKITRDWIATYGPFGTDRLPETFRWDLKAAHDIVPFGLDATVFVEIINATAHANAVDYIWSRDIRVREELLEFPTFLPLLGLEVRF